MTLEDRLREALHQVDSLEPSVDLFARLERSVAEDRAYRRRRLGVVAAVTVGLALVVAWLAMSAERGTAGRLFIDGWRLTVVYLTMTVAVVVALAPNIRRFARSFVDDVFHLSPSTGGKFLVVLDIAYYTAFTGLILVDADQWGLAGKLLLFSALDDVAVRIAFLLCAMGVLHAINIAFLPVYGLIYASIVRRDLRRRAGGAAPPESMAAMRADSAARGLAVGVVVLAGAVAISFLFGGPGLLFLGGLG